MDYKKVYKDNYYDNLVVKNLHTAGLKVGDEIITANGVGDLGYKYKFSFDQDNFNKRDGVCSGTFVISETEPENIDTSLSNIYEFQMSTTDLTGKDLLTWYKLLNSNEYLEENMLDIINIYKPQNRGKYYISSSLGFTYSPDPLPEIFDYRGFGYGYRINTRREYPTTTQLIIYQKVLYQNISLISNTDIFDDFIQVEYLNDTPNFTFIVLYNKSQTPFSLRELDDFVKRYIDNVLMTATTIAPIETMRDNFYTKYDAIRGGLDLYKDFQLLDINNEIYSYSPTITVSPGSGLQVTLSYFNQYYNIEYNGGSGYSSALVNKTFTVPGTSVGGMSPVNDAVIKVTSVSGAGTVTGLQIVSGVSDYLKGTEIVNGGNNRYDEGNKLFFDTIATSGITLSYGHGDIIANKFGTGSKYCCVYNDSIFSLMVTGNNTALRFYTGGAFDDSTDVGLSLYGIRTYNYVIMGLLPVAASGNFREGDIYSVNLSYSNYYGLPSLAKEDKETEKAAEKHALAAEKYKTFKPALKKLAAEQTTAVEHHIHSHSPVEHASAKKRAQPGGRPEKQIDVSRRNRNTLNVSIR